MLVPRRSPRRRFSTTTCSMALPKSKQAKVEELLQRPRQYPPSMIVFIHPDRRPHSPIRGRGFIALHGMRKGSRSKEDAIHAWRLGLRAYVWPDMRWKRKPLPSTVVTRTDRTISLITVDEEWSIQFEWYGMLATNSLSLQVRQRLPSPWPPSCLLSLEAKPRFCSWERMRSISPLWMAFASYSKWPPFASWFILDR